MLEIGGHVRLFYVVKYQGVFFTEVRYIVTTITPRKSSWFLIIKSLKLY